MMSFTEKLLERICIAVNGTSESTIDGKTISFKAPFPPFADLGGDQGKDGLRLGR